MILFDIEAALAHIAAQKPATVANPAKPANPLPAASPEPVLISGISGISEAGTLCAAHHGDLLAAPAGHCPACGSPSWWRSPSSPTWRCAYCEPRSRAEAFESLTLASGQWAPGTRPPADPGDDPPEPHAPRPPRPDDGRVQDAFGTWFTVQQRRAIAALDAHHWRCDRCRRAGRGYGERCAEGERLHAAMRAAS